MAVFNIKDTNTIINDVLINIVANIEEVTDVNPGSVLRTLVEALSLEIEALYTELQTVYNGTRIDTATADDLDNLGALLGITRKAGTVSSGNITFIRNAPAGADFTIAANSIIATQPNTGETQLTFAVNANTTFFSSIIGESTLFINGLYDYPLSERFIDSTSSLSGTALTLPYNFILNTDYQITTDFDGLVIDPNSIDTLDDCEATTGWNTGTGAIAIATDLVDYKQGVASLKLGKSTAIANTVYYDKTLGAVYDSTAKNAYLWIKVIDNTALAKLNKLSITVGSGGSSANSYKLEFPQLSLATGWNKYEVNFGDATIIKTGSPNRVAMNYLKFEITTNNVADLLTSGDIDMDFWILGTGETYVGDLITFLPTGQMPDNNTSFLTDYVPLSREVLCSSTAVGQTYNVARNKIIYKISFIASIDSVNNYDVQSGGTDVESDDDLRSRIQLATELKGKATAEALRQAVLAVEGITSVSVDDMPLLVSNLELHSFVSFVFTPTQALDFEVALDNVNLVVSGTRGGPITFINGVDYFLTDSVIEWVSIGTAPDPATNFFVTYDYRWLGHVRMFVAGTSTPLNPSVVADVDTAIEDTRAAGVDVQWAEPTVITVNLNVDVLADTGNGYIFADVAVAVESALEEFMNGLDTGADVYIADLFQVIQGVEGVQNSVVNAPASDVVIAINEVARPGTITVGSL